jgi:hypothetical protein
VLSGLGVSAHSIEPPSCPGCFAKPPSTSQRLPHSRDGLDLGVQQLSSLLLSCSLHPHIWDIRLWSGCKLYEASSIVITREWHGFCHRFLWGTGWDTEFCIPDKPVSAAQVGARFSNSTRNSISRLELSSTTSHLNLSPVALSLCDATRLGYDATTQKHVVQA